ncbi:hypothetical protein MRB53_040813 [Persea americana]|nr:hypothetical protein MRB53_040813 [Persea americana]
MSKIAAQPEQIPTEPQLATSCFDFLLIEIVPLAQRMVERLVAKEQAVRDEYKRAQTFHKHDRNRASISSVNDTAMQDEKTPMETDAASNTANSVPDTSGDTTTLAGAVDDEVREALFWRLDQMGYRVGQGLVERCVCYTTVQNTG